MKGLDGCAKAIVIIIAIYLCFVLLLSMLGIENPEFVGFLIFLGIFTFVAILALISELATRKKKSPAQRTSSDRHPSIPPMESSSAEASMSDREVEYSVASSTETGSYFDYCVNIAERIRKYILRTMKDDELMSVIENIRGIDMLKTDIYGKYNWRVVLIVLHDLWKCYEGVGFVEGEDEDADLCFRLAAVRLCGHEDMDDRIRDHVEPFYTHCRNIGIDNMHLMSIMGVQGYEGATDFLMFTIYDHADREYDEYIDFLIAVAECMAESEGEISEEAQEYIDDLIALKTTSSKTAITEEEDSDQEDETEKNSSQNEGIRGLDQLIGLAKVKEEARRLQSFVRVQQMRQKEGLKSTVVSYHCVFTGNPGTGKTTVARIVANIYKELGILTKGHLVETDRSGLVAEYVGQTAVKTNKIIDKALDGVLFIDEAYSLVSEGSGDYGLEAISTLLKRMEDDRERLVVIIAGYEAEMEKFIQSNPGLRSRFTRYFHFEDYNSDELWEIFKGMIDRNEYKLDEEAAVKIRGMIARSSIEGDSQSGNARYVRNLFEKIISNQAMRLAEMEDMDREKLRLITTEDIE